MEIDTKSAFEFGFVVFALLLIALVLNVFYPDDFSMFDRTLLINPLTFDAFQIGIWLTAIGIGGALGFFTSGNAMGVAITGILLGFIVIIFPLFLYMADIASLGLVHYPDYQIHQAPLILLLIIAVPLSVAFFIITLDLASSALHAASSGD